MGQNDYTGFAIYRNAVRHFLWLTVLCIGLTPFAAYADRVYSWKDPAGGSHLSSTPPPWLRNPSPSDPKVEAFEDGKLVPLIPSSQSNPRIPSNSGRTTPQVQAPPSPVPVPAPQYAPALAKSGWGLHAICTYGNDLSSMSQSELASRYCTVTKVARLHEEIAVDAISTIQWAQRNEYGENRILARSRLASATEDLNAHKGARDVCNSESQRILQQHAYLTRGTLKICCDYANNGYSCQ